MNTFNKLFDDVLALEVLSGINKKVDDSLVDKLTELYEECNSYGAYDEAHHLDKITLWFDDRCMLVPRQYVERLHTRTGGKINKKLA